ncbi:MAG: InlB B-repeat-containing protein [Oscillospiraceae bacterium]
MASMTSRRRKDRQRHEDRKNVQLRQRQQAHPAAFTVEDLITISFDPNGGTGTMQPMKVKSGENFTLPECTFTPPEGKEFAGWLAENGTVYPAGDIVFSVGSSVLKATWKDTGAAEITITFDPNGGTGTMQPMKVKSGENFTLPECTFTPPEGKEFAGWLAVNGKCTPPGHRVQPPPTKASRRRGRTRRKST